MGDSLKQESTLLESGQNQKSGPVPIIDPSVLSHRGDFFPQQRRGWQVCPHDVTLGGCCGFDFIGLEKALGCDSEAKSFNDPLGLKAKTNDGGSPFPLPHSQLRVLPTHSSHDCGEGV